MRVGDERLTRPQVHLHVPQAVQVKGPPVLPLRRDAVELEAGVSVRTVKVWGRGVALQTWGKAARAGARHPLKQVPQTVRFGSRDPKN